MRQNSILPVFIPPDNYSYLIFSGSNAVVIDASDALVILQQLNLHNFNLLAIFSTHHHSDHTAGNLALKDKTGCRIIALDNRVSGVDQISADGELFEVGGLEFQVMHVPGHTKKQAAFYSEELKCVFTGDTLFGAGCGRLFEGSADQMYHSLERLASLSETTSVYFGHEYTVENLEFALSVEPGNTDTALRLENAKECLSRKEFTVPSTILLEKKTNPFLRCKDLSIRKQLGMVNRSPVAVFAELRRRKDEW